MSKKSAISGCKIKTPNQLYFYVAVQSLSHVPVSMTPWTATCQASLSFTISWNLLKLMSIESVMPSNHLILCHRFLLLPSVFASIRVFLKESALCIRWPKCFSISMSPSNEYSGLISLRIDWFDLVAVQGTPKSLLQHHSPNVYGSSARRLLYGPTLTSVHDFRKTHTFDYEDLCWQNNVSAF